MGGHKHRVVKSIKPTEDEIMEMIGVKAFEENAKKAAGIHKSKKNLFWSKVELRTGEVTRGLHWNDEKQMIEIVVCDYSDKDSSGLGSQWES